MTRTLLDEAWPDALDAPKGKIRDWGGEVDARLPFQSRAEVEAAEILDAGSDVTSLVVLGHDAGLTGRLAVYHYAGITAPDLPADSYLRSADGAYWTLESAVPGICPLDFGAKGTGEDDTAALARFRAHVEAVYAARVIAAGEVPGEENWFTARRCAVSIDGAGLVYLSTEPVEILATVNMQRMGWIFAPSALGGVYGLKLGLTTDGPSRPQALRDVFVYADNLSESPPAALLYVPRVFAASFLNVSVNAGRGSHRTRYGAYFARHRGWSCDIIGGRYRGGKIPLRVGRESDHTGWKIHPTDVGHGSVTNLLGCNLKGATIQGRIEHSDGPLNITLTSQTNGSGDVLDAVTISNGYAYNTSNAAFGVGWQPENNIIQIGHDVPGTEGFDGAGVITSGPAADSISLVDSYAVSEHAATAVRARVLHGLRIEGLKWHARGRLGISGLDGTVNENHVVEGATSGASARVVKVISATELLIDSVDGEFVDDEPLTIGGGSATATVAAGTFVAPVTLDISGTGAGCYMGPTRDQNTGRTRPVVKSTASNMLMWNRDGGEYDPLIRGATTPGSMSANSNGFWRVINGLAFLSGFIDWSSRSGGAGNLLITLPTQLRPLSGQRAVAAIRSGTGLGGAHVEGLVTSGSGFRLFNAGGGALNWTDLEGSGSLSFSVQILVELPA